MPEQFIVFHLDTFTLIDGEDLGIYSAAFPNAIFAQVVDDEIYGYDIKRAGLLEKAYGFLADCRLEPTPLDEIEF